MLRKISLSIFLVQFILISCALGQNSFIKKYTRADGLSEIEVNSVFFTSDSLCYVTDKDNIFSIFDGYSFTPISTFKFRESFYCKRIIPLEKGDFIIQNGFKQSFYFNGNFDVIDVSNLNHFGNSNMSYYKGKLYYIEKNNHVFVFNEEKRKWDKSNVDDNILTENFEMETLALDSLNMCFIDDYSLLNNSNENVLNDSIKVFRNYLPKLFNQSNDYLIFRRSYKYLNTNYFKIDENNNIIDYFHLPYIYPQNAFPISNNELLIASMSGLFKMNNKIKYFSSSSKEMVSSLHIIVEDINKDIYFGGYGYGFSVWDGTNLKKIKIEEGIKEILPGAFKSKDGSIIFSTGKLKKLKNGEFSSFGIVDDEKHGYFIDTLSNGRFCFGLSRFGLGIEEDVIDNKIKIKIINKEKGNLLKDVAHFSEDINHRIWFGRSKQGVGIYDILKDTAVSFLRTTETENSFGTMSSTLDSRNNLWLGTNKGLKFVSKPHEFDMVHDDLYKLAKNIELPNGDKSLVTFMIQVDSFIVLGNRTSVSFVYLPSFYKTPDSPLIYQLLYGEDIDGGGSEQNAVLFDSQRRLWIGSQEGASMIKWDDYEFDNTKNKIVIKSMKSGGKINSFKKDKVVELPEDNRNCTIYFGLCRNISLKKNVFFDYFLVSEEGDTIKSSRFNQNGVFELEYISPGDYSLFIYAKKNGQLMDAITIKLLVPLSLSESPWILPTIIFIGLMLFFGYFYLNIRSERKLLEKDLQLNVLENEKEKIQIQAIVNSFNPHFINNSLHWVQSRYRKDENLVNLVDNLSSNIRRIFKNTKEGKAYHSLNEEIELVMNYINIQKIRFGDSFKFEKIVKCDQKYLENQILLMHLQIHVENALEHGIRNWENSSYVRLTIDLLEDSLIIYIEDDGGGRVIAKKYKSKGTQMGTKMIKRLIEIFNTKNKEKVIQYYEDGIFTDSKGIKHGTRVVIRYPLYYSFNL